MRIEVVGEEEVRRALERQGAAGRTAAINVLSRICLRVLPQARALAPDDPATEAPFDLKSSGRVSKPRINRKTGVVSVGVVFGGKPSRKHKLLPYAVVQEQGFAGIGKGGAFVMMKHDDGQSPFISPPFFKEAESAPAELLDELDREMKHAL